MAAAAAAVVLLHLRRALLHPFPLPAVRLRRHKPLLLYLSRSFASARPRGLHPASPAPYSDDDQGEDEALEGSVSGGDEKKSRNQLKREARRAVRWGMELANFSPSQIKRILRVAAVEPEVFDALMLVKRLGPDVREGKRRQFSYIGRLLREATPHLMDSLIQATKDGDDATLMAISSQATHTSDESEEDLFEEEEDNGDYVELAVRWFDGIVSKDASITNEVYSIHNIEFDRQELRRLVRNIHLVACDAENSRSSLDKVKKPLMQFLRSLARELCAEQSNT